MVRWSKMFELYFHFWKRQNLSKKSSQFWSPSLKHRVLGMNEFCPQSHNMIHTGYRMLSKCLWDAFHKKWPHKWFPVPGFWTMTVHCAQGPWLLWGSWQWFPICITHHIWSTVTFYSPGWLLPWRGNDLRGVVQIHLSTTQQLQAIWSWNMHWKVKELPQSLHTSGGFYFWRDDLSILKLL